MNTEQMTNDVYE